MLNKKKNVLFRTVQDGNTSYSTWSRSQCMGVVSLLLMLICVAPWADLHSEPAKTVEREAGAGSASMALSPPANNLVTATPVQSGLAQQLFHQVRPNLYKVRTLVAGTQTQEGVGSGFLVSQDGLVVTNYHVVANFVQYPDRYHIVLNDEQDVSLPVKLIAIDILHDLAVLKMDRLPADAKPLRLADSNHPLTKGQNLFSFGNPLDEGLSVIQGTYNGLAQRFFYRTYHFSGAINQGMSGGPVLNEQGRVIGVNVAKNTQGEQMSYLVPSEYVAELLKKAALGQSNKWDDTELTQQLQKHQIALGERLLSAGFRAEQLASRKIPVLQDHLAKCWGGQYGEKNAEPILISQTQCELANPVLVNQDFFSGGVQVTWVHYQNKGVSALRFSNVVSKGLATEALPAYESEEYYRQIRCTEDFVAHAKIEPMRLALCVSPYKKWKGLHSMMVVVAIQDRNQNAWLGRLDLDGFTLTKGLPIVRKWLEMIQ